MNSVEQADALLAATENYLALIHFYAKERQRLNRPGRLVIAAALVGALGDLEKIKEEVLGAHA